MSSICHPPVVPGQHCSKHNYPLHATHLSSHSNTAVEMSGQEKQKGTEKDVEAGRPDGETTSLAQRLTRPPRQRQTWVRFPRLVWIFLPGRAIPVTKKMVLQWLLHQMPGVIGSRGTGWPGANILWVGQIGWSAISASVWQHLK